MNASRGFEYFPSPVGWLLVAAGEEGINLVELCGHTRWTDAEIQSHLLDRGWKPADGDSNRSPLLRRVRKALERYFAEGTPLPSFPIDMSAGTPFQQTVWKALCSIPFGETRSYVQVARDVGKPLASRAVGGACGRNPVAILVPCHRVVAAGGLGGYGGGLDNKKILLDLERRTEPKTG